MKIKISKGTMKAYLTSNLFLFHFNEMPDFIELDAEPIETTGAEEPCSTALSSSGTRCHVHDCKGKCIGCSCPCHSKAPKEVKLPEKHAHAYSVESGNVCIYPYCRKMKLPNKVNQVIYFDSGQRLLRDTLNHLIDYLKEHD